MGHPRLISRTLLLVLAAASLAGCVSKWGPLAVALSQPVSTQSVKGAGTLAITDRCTFLDRPLGRVQLIWPAAATRWDPVAHTITLTNTDGPAVSIRDGDAIEVVGYYGDGVFRPQNEGGDFSKGSWLVEPDPSCGGQRWAVFTIHLPEPDPS